MKAHWRKCVRLPSRKEIETLAHLPTGRDYANVDSRWGVADPVIVSIEIPTVLGAAPLCCYIINQLVRNDPARHFWIIVLSTVELYGG